jgi:lipoprotein NlpI
MGKLDLAEADLVASLDLEPKNRLLDKGLYLERARAFADFGRLENAVADFNKALTVDPNLGRAYISRGYQHYDLGNWSLALQDFRKGCHLGQFTDPLDEEYALMRTFLLRARLGERESAALELREHCQSRKQDGNDPWPGTILAFLSGSLPESQFLGAAQSPDAQRQKEQQCEAYFYAGTMQLIEGNAALALEYLKKCLDTGQRNFTEYDSAVQEIKRLEAVK